MCTVLNKKQLRFMPPNAVYVGRPTIFGNPFEIGRDGNRDEVCDKFEAWIAGRPRLIEAAKRQLKNKDLVCWCAPARCHAQTLMRIANEE